jgi:undecaprenyl phosphate N,N'-diacetylbacillosamine 1-phosphate transferase
MYSLIKRTSDFVIAAAALLLTSPLLVLCACAVRWSSSGPVLFAQMRLGRNGQPFRLLKFRTMYVNASDVRNSDGSAYCGEDDARVTRVGRFLRKTSLDELPQFVNVLYGDMSLVGPRPDQVDQFRFYTEQEKRKLLVKPGITGLAQISGRNRISWELRKSLDAKYVETQSVLLDVKILFKTVPCVLIGRGVANSKQKESC